MLIICFVVICLLWSLCCTLHVVCLLLQKTIVIILLCLSVCHLEWLWLVRTLLIGCSVFVWQPTIDKHSSGTSNKCLEPSRIQFSHTRLLEKSTRYSGHQLNQTGLPSATITVWKYSVFSCWSHLFSILYSLAARAMCSACVYDCGLASILCWGSLSHQRFLVVAINTL